MRNSAFGEPVQFVDEPPSTEEAYEKQRFWRTRSVRGRALTEEAYEKQRF